MFVVTLTFSDNKSAAQQWMDDHNNWIRQGVEAGVFLLVGSLQPNRGGAILAQDISLERLQERIAQDPFVEHQVVQADILEISPKVADPRLSFLLP